MENNYTSYQGMMAQVDAALTGMEQVCQTLEMEESQKRLLDSRKKLEGHRFAVGILGEFKRGKSTVINSLLEKEIMPANIRPCSATMNRVTYDMQPHVELKMIDGSTCEIKVEELASYVTKLTSENESRAANVDEAIVYYPCVFCQNGVDIVDTPGLNDDERMNKITEEIIPKLDAVIMVLTWDSPFSMSEAEFVRNKLMTSDLSRLIFLVNKMDMVDDPDDRASILEHIKEKIQDTVLGKMEEMYGVDSNQYQDAKLKLGNIRIYPFSGRAALKGKLKGDAELLEISGTAEFEAGLTKMLTEERGALELGTPISVLQRTAVEVTKTIETRRNALSMSAEEFEKRQSAALEKIKDLRVQKKSEKRRLSERAKQVRNDLTSRSAQFYPQLERSMAAVVDNYNPDPKSFATSNGQKSGAEELQKKVAAELNESISNFSEKIMVELQDVIQQETVSVAQFTSSVSSQIDSLRVDLSNIDTKRNTTDLVATGVDILTDYIGIYGIGGLVAGYQAAGIKGALAGGGMGLVANLAVAGILGSLSIVGLPMVVISCAVGTLVSRKFTGAIFADDIGQKKLAEIKKAMKGNISSAIRDMQVNRNIENWIEETVTDQFDELITAMEDECENLLTDSESSMNEIQKDLTQNDANRANTLKRLDDQEKRCLEILKELEPVCKKVEAVLKETA